MLTDAFIDCDGGAPDARWLKRFVTRRHPVSGVRTGQRYSTRSGTCHATTHKNYHKLFEELQQNVYSLYYNDVTESDGVCSYRNTT